MNRDEIARMRPLERKALLEEVAGLVFRGELGLGDAARFLRGAVLGMDRQTFARVVKVSPRAIAKLEDDPRGNPTLDTLTKVFGPFGGKLGLVFPQMEEPPPPDEASSQRREAILAALAKTRRRRRVSAG